MTSTPLHQPSALPPPGAAPGRAALRMSGPELTEADFNRIADIAYKAAGLAIGPAKSAMVRTRLCRRLRALNLQSYEAYCAYLDGKDGAEEIGMFVSALTTNVSHFFREAHHFEILRQEVLPPLAARARAGGRVRIWSAGCANGQEPYSIAMSMIEAGMPFDRDVRLLATDIDRNVISHAREGLYAGNMLSGLPDAQRTRFFERASASPAGGWRVKDQVRAAVRFRVLNLVDTWPMRGRFDVIFCRNVVIYFDTQTQDRLWRRFAELLAPGGWLFIGHSERLAGSIQARFHGRGVTAYQHEDRSTGVSPDTGPSQKGF